MSQDALNTTDAHLINDLSFGTTILGISEHTVKQFDTCVYTHDLLHACLTEKLGGELPTQLTVVQNYILAQQAEELSVLAIRIGCVVRAHSIQALVNGEKVRHLAHLTTPYLMEDACWAPVDFSGPAGREDTLEELADTIRQLGCIALHVWCDAQPAPIALRVRMLLPQSASSRVRVPENAVNMVDTFVVERLCDN